MRQSLGQAELEIWLVSPTAATRKQSFTVHSPIEALLKSPIGLPLQCNRAELGSGPVSGGTASLSKNHFSRSSTMPTIHLSTTPRKTLATMAKGKLEV